MNQPNVPDPSGAWLQSAPGQRFHAVAHYLPGHLNERPALTHCGRALPCTAASRVKLLVGTEDACAACAKKVAR